MILNLLVVIVGYLLGSIPTAYLMARFRNNRDIRDYGVGNMGAANVIQHVGIWEGLLVGLIDIAKGAAAVLIGMTLGASQIWVFVAGAAALLGHNFPVFAGFRGGKGAATVLGIFLVLAPKEIAIVLGIIGICLFITRNFSFSISVSLVFLPLLIWLFIGSLTLVIYSLAIIIFMGLKSLPHVRQAFPWVMKNRN
jgi:glycerol-3-phosphate acyltransferase PlsY